MPPRRVHGQDPRLLPVRLRVTEAMRRVARGESERTRPDTYRLISDQEVELTLEDEERLLLGWLVVWARAVVGFHCSIGEDRRTLSVVTGCEDVRKDQCTGFWVGDNEARVAWPFERQFGYPGPGLPVLAELLVVLDGLHLALVSDRRPIDIRVVFERIVDIEAEPVLLQDRQIWFGHCGALSEPQFVCFGERSIGTRRQVRHVHARWFGANVTNALRRLGWCITERGGTSLLRG